MKQSRKQRRVKITTDTMVAGKPVKVGDVIEVDDIAYSNLMDAKRAILIEEVQEQTQSDKGAEGKSGKKPGDKKKKGDKKK